MKKAILTILLFFTINSIGQNIETSKSYVNSKEINKLNKELELLKNQLDTYNLLLNGALIVFTVLIAVGSGFSIFSLVKNESRESKAFKIAMSSYKESKEESPAIKEREDRHFEASYKTLTLVNETLTLARDASKRASESLENRLVENLKNLEMSSAKIIQDTEAFIDDKNLTTDIDNCSEIHRIGRKIEGLENNLIILEGNKISLKPNCNFIRATDSYLSEQFDQALEYIEQVLFLTETTNELKSLAYYWKAYIQNNLGEFKKAKLDFGRAKDIATDSRSYELRRIELETRFFNKEDSNEILIEFEKLLKSIENDKSDESKSIIDSRKAKIKTTIGNVYYQLAREDKTPKIKEEYFKKSLTQFAELLNIDIDSKNSIYELLKNNPNKEKLKWTIFGLAETMYQSNFRKEEAIEIFREIVYHSAENEFLNREEKRTKVLAKTTQLICDIRSNQSETKISQTKALVESALSSVDKRLTLYSQIQRRNVKREVFRNDLEILINQA